MNRSDRSISFMDFVRAPVIQIAVAALAAGSFIGTWRHDVLREKEKTLPLAFSERSSIMRTLKAEGKVRPLTDFYTQVNELTMKVFEKNNEARKISDSNKTFAGLLEFTTDPSLKIHTQIPKLAKELPVAAAAAKEVLKEIAQARKELPAINTSLDRAWSDHHNDVKRTERYTEEVCDKDKKNCHDEPRTREVYDHTDHTYIYDAKAGKISAQLLAAFLKAHPNLQIAEQLVTAKTTEADNEYAIFSTHKKELKGRRDFTPQEYLAFANTWATGSTLQTNRGDIDTARSRLDSFGPQWIHASKYAKSAFYSTTSTSDSGPQEFQIAGYTLEKTQELEKRTTKIIDGIDFAALNAPKLESTVKAYIEASFNGKDEDADRLREQVIGLAREIYLKNIEGGFDVDPFNPVDVALCGILGLVLGGGLAYGGNVLYNRRRYGEWSADPR